MITRQDVRRLMLADKLNADEATEAVNAGIITSDEMEAYFSTAGPYDIDDDSPDDENENDYEGQCRLVKVGYTSKNVERAAVLRAFAKDVNNQYDRDWLNDFADELDPQ